jgi:Leucine-rich repeat (LRR) protein
VNVPDIARLAASLPCLLELSLHRAKGILEVDALARHPRLERLVLTGTDLTDVQPLATLPALRELYLKETRVRDLAPLAQARSLEFLNLEGSAVDDVRALFELPRLREVWLFKTKVPEKQVNELKARLHGRAGRMVYSDY